MTLDDIARNVAHVKEEIRRAALESGRQPEEMVVLPCKRSGAYGAGATFCGIRDAGTGGSAV